MQLNLDILYRLPAIRFTKTLECISNWVNLCERSQGGPAFGCDLISTAVWKGVRLSDVFALAGGVKANARSIAVIGADEFSSSIPPDPQTLASTLLVYEMNDQVLPLEHGYPARLLIPNRYGMKSPKWVIAMRPTNEVHLDWYGQRGWNLNAFVQTITRIDAPIHGQIMEAGDHTIAGIAYAGSRGISQVEYSADGGANLAAGELRRAGHRRGCVGALGGKVLAGSFELGRLNGAIDRRQWSSAAGGLHDHAAGRRNRDPLYRGQSGLEIQVTRGAVNWCGRRRDSPSRLPGPSVLAPIAHAGWCRHTKV